ncbi:MAG: bifunctional 4-hydroxy-2-oxoglutarate aldolase/2-dehydro-3-deoxy-phosphogluconate aldolase [Meiothermus sp.]|nr:bifunctional 4-hydroxy-2-oxoglutarate aldolase/2-dehydro-3-deoxy-phosphogluconate aldolase [Meiothermus sp.]
MNVDYVELSLRHARVVGVLRASSPEAALQASLAAVRGGLKALELTFTTPGAPEVLGQLSRLGLPVLLGAGTVMNATQGEAALEAGAQFLVSPHLDEDLLALSRASGVPYIPGVLTPGEVQRALSLGAQILKIFPIGSSGAAAYLKDLLGPFPRLRALVTGGVSPAEVPLYLRTGALAVGLGSNLFPGPALDGGLWGSVEQATRAALGEARGAG